MKGMKEMKEMKEMKVMKEMKEMKEREKRMKDEGRKIGEGGRKRRYVTPENGVYAVETARGILAGSGGVRNNGPLGNEYEGDDVTY